MPLPTPNAGESQDDFISRCMGDDVMTSEYPENDQRGAVCMAQWEDEGKAAGGVETKFLTWSSKVDSIDREARTITAKISTDTIDRDREVLLPKGALLDKYRKNPTVLWAHDYAAKPIGKALWIKTTASDVVAKVQFAPTEEGNEVFELYAGGFLNAWSVGFLPVQGKGRAPTEADIKKRPDWAGVQWIHGEWELLEFSAVPVPSNPEALSLAVSKGLVLPSPLGLLQDLMDLKLPEDIIIESGDSADHKHIHKHDAVQLTEADTKPIVVDDNPHVVEIEPKDGFRQYAYKDNVRIDAPVLILPTAPNRIKPGTVNLQAPARLEPVDPKPAAPIRVLDLLPARTPGIKRIGNQADIDRVIDARLRGRVAVEIEQG